MKVYRYVTLTAALLAVATCSQLSASQIELTTNGGFETGDTSGWTSFPTANSTFLLTNDANSGTFAAEVFNNDSGSSAVIKQANLAAGLLTPGQQIDISFAAKGLGTIGGVVFAEFFSELAGEGVSKAEILGGAPLALTDQYQTFNFSTTAGPDVSGGVTLQFAVVTGADIGSTSLLFIDDASVKVGSLIPEPTSVALAGIGLLGLVGVAKSRRRS